MAQSQSTPVRNVLLAALAADVLNALMPKLILVPLTLRQTVYTPDAGIEHVYFPENGMFSLVANLEDGMQAEVGLIGREGMLGITLLSGVDTSFVESMVQMPGSAYKMTAKDFRHEMEANPALRVLLLRYAETLNAQIMQTAACNGRHGLEQRLARWLLMAHDRAEANILQLTQEFLGMMLAVHRPSITVTANILQRAGLIEYAGGRINVLDRPSLEAAACECYGLVQRRYVALLP